MKLTYIALIVLVFILGLTVNSFVFDVNSKYLTNYSVELNIQNTTIDLNETNRVLTENRILLERIDQKKLDCKAEFNVPRIQFYPRKERECRNPIDWFIWGSSMQPFLYEDDTFFVEKVRFNQLELGDVIVFEQGDKTTIHAITAIYKDFVITAGYNNLYEDRIVKQEDIKYRYCE